MLHKGSVCKMNGNRHVIELWNDNGKRNVNLNNWDDNWNPSYRFLRVRTLRIFLPTLFGGKFFVLPAFSILQAFFLLLQVLQRYEYISLCLGLLFQTQAGEVVLVSHNVRLLYQYT